MPNVTASATQCYVSPVFLTGGELFVWGTPWDARGMLGTGDTLDKDTPTQIWSPNGGDITSVHMSRFCSAFFAGMPYVHGGHGYGSDLVECTGVGWMGAGGLQGTAEWAPFGAVSIRGCHERSVCRRSGSS